MTIFPLFLVPIFSGLIAQALKTVFNTKRSTPANLPKYGGMPSAHTAFAVSLVTIVGLNYGITTAPFALAVAFMIYTLDDALRMRIFLGRYGQALKQLAEKLPANERKNMPFVETRLGHTPLEVTVGAIIGFVVSVLIFVIFRHF